jgi:hypothetical protein
MGLAWAGIFHVKANTQARAIPGEAEIMENNQDRAMPSLYSPRVSKYFSLMRITWGIIYVVILGEWLYLTFTVGDFSLANSLFSLVMPLGFFILAAIIFIKRPNDPMALVTSLMLVFVGPYLTGGISSEFTRYPHLHYLSTALEIVGVSLTGLFLFTFPNGAFTPRWSLYLFGICLALSLSRIFVSVYEDAVVVYLFLFEAVLGLLFQIVRYQTNSTATEKQQAKWAALGFSGPILAVAWWFFILLPRGAITYSSMSTLEGDVVAVFGLAPLLLPVGITIAILRYKLWEIDLIIRRTLLYSVLSILLGLVYLGCVVMLQQVFATINPQAEQSNLSVVISTLAVAALFTPLRLRIQKGIDRHFYRSKYDAEKALAAFAISARKEVVIDNLTSSLLSVVEDTMQPSQAILWMKAKPTHRNELRTPGQ